MNHTPAPWRLVEHLANHDIWKDGLIIARAFKFEKDYATADANARLIAAAPEMLEAIRDLFVQRGYIRGFDFEKLETAFRKATGETNYENMDN